MGIGQTLIRIHEKNPDPHNNDSYLSLAAEATLLLPAVAGSGVLKTISMGAACSGVDIYIKELQHWVRENRRDQNIERERVRDRGTP